MAVHVSSGSIGLASAMAKANTIAVLTCPVPESWIVINALAGRFGAENVHVLAEQRVSRRALILKRMRKRGIVTVLGQIGFVLLQKVIDRRQRGRYAELVSQMDLQTGANPTCPLYPVGSVNSMAARAALAMVRPDVVVVIGTRIIGRATLGAIDVPVINVHGGWNPLYRGQAGGYWALAKGDPEHAGITIHLVDPGVDTGAILYQERFTPTRADSFGTYFYIQSGIARAPLVRAVEDALNGALRTVTNGLPSAEHFHPTLWGYLWTALRRGVW